MSKHLMLTAVAVLVVFVSLARAELPPQDKKVADVVVVGTVVKLTTKDVPFGGDGVRTDYTAEVKVKSVERGDKVKEGDVIKVNWFHVAKKPSRPFAGAFGHKYGVKEKDTIKAYIIKAGDGTLPIIYNRDGIEKVKE